MTRILWCTLLVLLLLPASPRPAAAQLGRAAVGGAAGVAGGAVVTLAVIVARARFQHRYLESINDVIHWQTIPMIGGPAAGIVFGLAGEDALRGSIVGSTTGMLAGATLGAAMGWILADQAESPWAGGVIGAGVGLTIGGLAGGLRAWRKDEEAGMSYPDLLRFGVSIPVR